MADSLSKLNNDILKMLAEDPVTDIVSSPGNVIMFNNLGVARGVNLVEAILTITDDSQLEEALGKGQNFGEVFNTWQRISTKISGVPTFDDCTSLLVNPTEANNWTYNEPYDKVYCTANTGTAVGFVSNTYEENFEFECLINNNNGPLKNVADDDTTGLILGVIEENGKVYMLSYCRNTGGHGSTCHHALLVNTNYVHALAKSSSNIPASNLWNSYGGGCRVKVIRRGNIITCKTTKAQTSYANAKTAPFEEAATLTFDLDSNPATKRFKGPQRFGYVSWSQQNSNFETLQSPIRKQTIVNVSNNKVWIYNIDTGDYDESMLSDTMTKGFFYADNTNEKMYFCTIDGNLEEMK